VVYVLLALFLVGIGVARQMILDIIFCTFCMLSPKEKCLYLQA